MVRRRLQLVQGHGQRPRALYPAARREPIRVDSHDVRKPGSSDSCAIWNNVGAGMVIGGMAGAFFLDKPPGAWTKIGIAMAGLALGLLFYSIASAMLTYMDTQREERR